MDGKGRAARTRLHGWWAAWICALATAIGGVALTGTASAARVLYVSDAAAKDVGSLTLLGLSVPGGVPSPLTPPSIDTGGGPQHVALTSDGRFAYATAAEPGLLHAYRVSASDGSLTPLATVAAGIGAHGVSVTPNGRFLYLAAQEPGTVFQYRIGADGVPVPMEPASVPSGDGASGVAISPDGESVFVTNLRGASVSQFDVDPATGALTPKAPATLRTPLAPSGLAVAPNGRSLYVATLTGRIAQFDIDRADGTLRPMRPARVRVGLGAAGVAITPDGRYLYTPNGLADTVSQFAIDRRTGRLSPLRPAAVHTGAGPEGIAMAPNGRAVYASAAGENAVTWLTIGANGRLTTAGREPLAAGMGPHGVTISPNQGPVARLTAPRSVRVGKAVRFDARASSDPDGSVRRYHWSFGDGVGDGGRTAVAVHRFDRPGRYTVRLRVADDEGCSATRRYTGQTTLCNGSRAAVVTRRITVRRAAQGG